MFVNSRRIRDFLPRLRPAQNELHNLSSFVNRVLRTPLAFDVLILRQRKAIQDYETDPRNIAGGRSGISIDALDSGFARSTVRSNGNRKRSAFRFLRGVLATPLYLFATSRSCFARSAGPRPKFFFPSTGKKYVESRRSGERSAPYISARLITELFVQ
jgi:hypothetical protein